MKQKKNIAIIPARGGSKRFKNKNVALLDSIPLISHTIRYALLHKQILTDVFVSTDCQDIAAIALAEGAKIIKRPASLSGDDNTTASALKHALETVTKIYDNVILLQPTNPLRPSDLLENCYFQFINGSYDSLMTLSRNEQKLGKIIEERFIPFNYTFGQRSQDLDPLYYENGLIYITKSELIKEATILGKNNSSYIVEHPYANVDIDVEEDLKYAEFIKANY